MRRPMSLMLAVVAVCAATACDRSHGARSAASSVATLPRRTMVWIGPEGVDLTWAERLQRAGVDGLVILRGRVFLRGSTPVLRLDPPPTIEGSIPVAIALRLETDATEIDPGIATSIWDGLIADPDWEAPSEVLLDLPTVVPGMAELVTALGEVSATPVVPILSFDQLDLSEGLDAARRAGTCVVPAFGTGASWLRGLDGSPPTLPLRERLQPLVAEGVRVRIAVSTVPRTDPAVEGWGDELGLLAEGGVSDVSTSSALDRTFVLDRKLSWSGRDWQIGDEVAVRWFDASRLDAAFEEIGRIVLPEIAGWDVVRLPPRAEGLGMGREAFVRYLSGEGPGPAPEVTAERSGRIVRVRIENPTPFGSAVTSVGNFVEISVASGALVAEDRGEFDGVELGMLRGGEFRPTAAGRFDAVHLQEIHLAPGESITSGPVRVPTDATPVSVRWQVMLSSGERLVGRVPL